MTHARTDWDSAASSLACGDVLLERERQFIKWGEQNHKDGTGSTQDKTLAEFSRQACDAAFKMGLGTWADILTEEYCEALAESDPVKLRAELIQVAAVCVAWVEAIDRREAAADAA
jgi:hypothetical protein